MWRFIFALAVTATVVLQVSSKEPENTENEWVDDSSNYSLDSGTCDNDNNPTCTNPNEVYDPCDAPCPARRCDFNAEVVRCAAPPKVGDPSCLVGCRCKNGYLRDSNGVCIPAKKCPKCTKANQVYDECPDCSPQTCKTKDKRYNCPLIPANKSGPNCHPACRCKPGYFKNLIGVCISASDCDKCPAEHEYYSCGSACDNVCATLSKQNQTNCPIKNIKCNERCYCENGFARATNNTCIPIKDCKDDCKKNEVYASCPAGSCAPLTCAQAGYSIKCAKYSKCPGEPGCICKSGYLKNNKGICIPSDQCPSCGGDENAKPGCGINCGRKCSDIGKKVTACPLICRLNGCDCKDNYYFDANKQKCVPECDCNQKIAPQPTSPPVSYTLQTISPTVSNTTEPTGPPVSTTQPTSSPVSNPNQNSCGDIDSLQRSLGENINTLDIKSLYELDVATPGISTVLSSFSYSVLLAELALYAKDQTYTELINVLNVTSKDDIRCGFPGLLKSLQVTEGAELDIGNKIYVNDQYQLSDQFKNDAVVVFNAGAENINFNNPTQAANTINKWVSDETKGKITGLVSADMLNAMTRLVLANAIYFKGIWKKEFNPNLTQSCDFYVDSQKTINVQMMQQKGKFNYADSSEIDAQLVEIPYQNENISFILVSPNKQDGLRNVLDKMRDPATNIKVLSELRQETVTIFMPKFNISSKINVIDILKPIGVQTIFGSNAELSGMVVPDEALYVSDALQKATITVNEQGSEAAAATAIGVTTLSATIQPPREFIIRADRPFLYGIRYNKMFLFSGIFYG